MPKPIQAHQPRGLARAVGVGGLAQRGLPVALALRLVRRALRRLLLRPPLCLRTCSRNLGGLGLGTTSHGSHGFAALNNAWQCRFRN